MAHDHIGHALQRQHNALARAQVQELQQIHAHLHLQQQQQRAQATLAEALVQTELRARQVAFVAADDPFAAAVLAHMWQSSVGQFGANQFIDADDKRAWLAAWAQLDRTRSFLDHNPTEATSAHRYLSDMKRIQSLGQMPYPLAVQDAKKARDRADHYAGANGMFVTALAAYGVAFLVWCMYLGLTHKPKADGPVDSVMTLLLMFAVPVAFFVYKTSSARTTATAHYVALAERVEAHENFELSEGPFLRDLCQQHPWLQRALPGVEHLPPVSGPGMAAAPQVMHSIVQRDVVERQVVVARCKFCQGLTPVDAPNCQHCGAFTFV